MIIYRIVNHITIGPYFGGRYVLDNNKISKFSMMCGDIQDHMDGNGVSVW